MSYIPIPITEDSPDQIFTLILEGVSYDMRLQWNNRDESWEIFLGRQGQPPMFTSKLTTNADVLKLYKAYEDTPNGVLVVLDSLKKSGRISRDGFTSGRFVLLYITSDTVSDYNQSLIDTFSLDGIFDVSNDTRFISVPTPNFGIPFDGVFTS